LERRIGHAPHSIARMIEGRDNDPTEMGFNRKDWSYPGNGAAPRDPPNTDRVAQRSAYGIVEFINDAWRQAGNNDAWRQTGVADKDIGMEWDAPAIILDARPYGEGDAVATVMTEEHGVHRGLARGGASRGKAATWQAGNMVQVQWTARMSDHLGSFTGEMIHAGAAHAMQEAMSLSMLTAICAVAQGALPEREPLPRVFSGLLRLIPRLPLGAPLLTEIIQWESVVLSDLGYGLDLSACAVTGRTDGLAYVSPRTGRAVTVAGAGAWTDKLLPLPGFLVGTAAPDPVGWRDGLRLTGYFLARDAFGHQHRPLPLARGMLYDRVSAMAADHGKDDVTKDAG
jgi:DNA repair protein RecO (recombination protein O)